MNKTKQILSFLLILILVGILLFSYEYIFEHLNHQCSGESCPICVQIETATQIIYNISLTFIPLFVIISLLLEFKSVGFFFKKYIFIKHTLILLKVELLD